MSQTRLADDVTRHGADWNCVRVVLGMGETNCNVASNFDFNHSHNFCALVVAHSVRAASILHQQPVEPLGEFGPSARLRPRRGLSLALLLSLVAASQFLAEFLGDVAFLRQPDQVRSDGARGARWRRRSVSPSGGFTSPGSMYFFPSISWAAYGSDTATCRTEA